MTTAVCIYIATQTVYYIQLQLSHIHLIYNCLKRGQIHVYAWRQGQRSNDVNVCRFEDIVRALYPDPVDYITGIGFMGLLWSRYCTY